MDKKASVSEFARCPRDGSLFRIRAVRKISVDESLCLVWHRRRCFEEPTVLIPKRQEPREGSETLQGGHRPYGCDSGKVQKILMDRIGKLE